MTATIIANPTADVDVDVPLRADGRGYRYEMIFDRARSRAYADTTSELLAVLIGGYESLDTDERLTSRIRYASDLLAPAQAAVLARADQRTLAPEDLAVLTQPRFQPVVVDAWGCPVPLVLLDVHYAPYTNIPAPVSSLEDVTNPVNIHWVRPADEFELLASLDRLGLISLAESNDYIV